MAQKKRKVKRAKPRKRKKPLTSKQRSRAAKKGWKTRRDRYKAFKAKIDKGRKRIKQEIPELDTVKKDIFERGLMFAIQQLPIKDQEAALANVISAYVDAEMMEGDDETRMKARLIIADSEGRLDDEVKILAAEFDMDVRDVYTLWISPK